MNLSCAYWFLLSDIDYEMSSDHMPQTAIPRIYPDVPNWWYHYYSVGLDRRISKVSKECFCLHPSKSTPDFRNYRYDYWICHFQIGENIVPGKSIVVLKTTIGQRNAPLGFLEKSQFVTGYFRVHTVNQDEEYIIMDKKDSLFLLDAPVRIDIDWANKLFPDKKKSYWMPSKSLVQKLGSMTRNRYINKRGLMLILRELYRRKHKGSTNYLGPIYNSVCAKTEFQNK